MNLEFLTTGRGDQTLKVNGIPVHSLYNPVAEAERYVSSIELPFAAKAIIVTFPCLSYMAPFLRKRFPQCKILAVQFSKDFSKYDSLWDKVFFADEENLSERIFNFLGDEILMSTLFLSWNPSQKVFACEYQKVWEELKKAVLKSRNILNTKSHFSKKWFTNTVRFALLTKTFANYKHGSCPIVVAASGPSLESSIPFLKKNRKNYFLIALSSSLSVLCHHKLIPDLCLSTDAGFWAKKHLERSLTEFPQIALAMPAEAACPGAILESSIIVPLEYDDGFEKAFYTSLGIKRHKAFANGTVSGTAALFALGLTSGPVFFTGLDLASSSGFQHTQPNELEIFDSQKDFRFNSTENRNAPKSFENPALEIYKNWFASQDFQNRLFRLSNNFSFSNKLGKIPDVNFEFFENMIQNFPTQKMDFEIFESPFSTEQKIQQISKVISSAIQSPDWTKKLFPVETTLLERALEEKSKKECEKDLNEKINSFTKSLSEKFFSTTGGRQ